jgi:hypothetical protein
MRSTVKISIHPKAKKILIMLGVIAVLGIAIFATLPQLHNNPVVPAIGTSTDAQAAVDATTAFYTLDYTADPDLWATRVCAHTTEAGCSAIQSFFAQTIEAMVIENHVQTTCTVAPVRLVSDNGSIRVWQVTVTINNPWPGLENPIQDAFIEVEDVNGTWFMNRILFQQEINTFLTPSPEFLE